MRHLLHRSLIAVVIGGALLIGSASPILADAGVTISTSVTVTGGGSGGGSGGGGGGWGGSNGSFPYTPPDWASIFPSMNQRGSSAQVDNRPVAQNPPIYIPPVLPQSHQSESTTIPSTPAKEDFKIDWFLVACLAAIIIAGIIIVVLLIRSRRQY